MTEPQITVVGVGEVVAEPDRVDVALELSAIKKTADEALVDVRERSAKLTALLDELAVPPEGRTTASVFVSQHREQDRDRWIAKGYRASTRTVVRLHDASPLGRLLAEAVARVEAQVTGPWWSLADDNPGYAEACGRAAQDARRKAEGYAAALGGACGAVVRIAEPGTGPTAHAPEFGIQAMAVGGAPTRGGAPAVPDLDVTPARIPIRAQVEVTFAFVAAG